MKKAPALPATEEDRRMADEDDDERIYPELYAFPLDGVLHLAVNP